MRGGGGTTSGDGVLHREPSLTVLATSYPGLGFVNRTKDCAEVGPSAGNTYALHQYPFLKSQQMIFGLYGCSPGRHPDGNRFTSGTKAKQARQRSG